MYCHNYIPPTTPVSIEGSAFHAGDAVALIFASPAVTKTYTLGSAENASTIAMGLAALINGDRTLSNAAITATSSNATISITQGNTAVEPSAVTSSVTGTGNETVSWPTIDNGRGGAGNILSVPTGSAQLFAGMTLHGVSGTVINGAIDGTHYSLTSNSDPNRAQHVTNTSLTASFGVKNDFFSAAQGTLVLGGKIDSTIASGGSLVADGVSQTFRGLKFVGAAPGVRTAGCPMIATANSQGADFADIDFERTPSNACNGPFAPFFADGNIAHSGYNGPYTVLQNVTGPNVRLDNRPVIVANTNNTNVRVPAGTWTTLPFTAASVIRGTGGTNVNTVTSPNVVTPGLVDVYDVTCQANWASVGSAGEIWGMRLTLNGVALAPQNYGTFFANAAPSGVPMQIYGVVTTTAVTDAIGCQVINNHPAGLTAEGGGNHTVLAVRAR
jgi:hypothetical protein